MVSVEHPDPPEEAKFNTESKGDVMHEVDELSSGDEAHANFSGVFQRGIMPGSPEYETFRVQEVIIQRLLKELCQIEGLKERVLHGGELDAPAAREAGARRRTLYGPGRSTRCSGSSSRSAANRAREPSKKRGAVRPR